jgi:hypothetical protein
MPQQESKDSFAANNGSTDPKDMGMYTYLGAQNKTPTYRRRLIKLYQDMCMTNLSLSDFLQM